MVHSYHADVPSFGDWGFHLGYLPPVRDVDIQLSVSTRFLTPEVIDSLFVFGKDVGPVDVSENTLTNMKLFSYYDDDDWE